MPLYLKENASVRHIFLQQRFSLSLVLFIGSLVMRLACGLLCNRGSLTALQMILLDGFE
jgi:hypothetical protein